MNQFCDVVIDEDVNVAASYQTSPARNVCARLWSALVETSSCRARTAIKVAYQLSFSSVYGTGIQPLPAERPVINVLQISIRPTCYHNVHRVPKLATPLASNTLNSVWSSWVSTKYRILHCLSITYCREQVYKVKVNDVDELRQRMDRIGWTWSAYHWQGDQAVAYPPKSLRRGQRWPLWAQTLKTSSEWSSLWMFHIL